MDKNQIIEDLRSRLVSWFPKKEGLATLNGDDNLQTAGIDSLDTIALMSHVEDTYSVTFDRFEGTYFDTLGRIADLILSKKA